MALPEWVKGWLGLVGVTSDDPAFSSFRSFLLFHGSKQRKSSKSTYRVDGSIAAVGPPLMLNTQFRYLRSV